MGTAFIHIGVSKTATTTLQRNLFAQLGGIQYLGKPGPHERDGAVEGFSKENSALLERTLENMVGGRVCPRHEVETLRTVIENLKKREAPVVYSNELLVDNKHISFADIATGLKDIFGPSELLVAVRDPQTALHSVYLHEMACLPDSHLCFPEWLDEAIANPRRINRRAESLEQYRYAFMLDQFRAVFEKITVLRYEDLVDSPSGFSHALSTLLGVNPKGIEDLLAKPPKNPTRSPLFYHYRRLVHKVRSHAPFLSSYSVARKLNDAIERITEKLPKQPVSISQRDRNRIADFFPYPIDERELSK